MAYPSPTLDGFDALVNHPISWFKRQFVFYGAVSAVTAVAFVIGAVVYSYLIQSADNTPVPDRKPFIQKPIQFQSWPESIPMADLQDRAIGAPIFFQDKQIGTVSNVIKNTEGNIVGIVIYRRKIIPDNEPKEVPESVLVNSNKFEWGMMEQKVTGILIDGSVLNGVLGVAP